MFEAVEISREITGSGQNLLLCGDAYQQQPALSALAGQVQAVYIDPPFMTGETFTRRRRFGTLGRRQAPSRIPHPPAQAVSIGHVEVLNKIPAAKKIKATAVAKLSSFQNEGAFSACAVSDLCP